MADALGLAFFTVGGGQITQHEGYADPIAVIMGTITGVAGGAIRDILTAESPLALRPSLLYATAAIAGGALYLVLAGHGLQQGWAVLAGMGTTARLRLAAILWGLGLPAVRLPDEKPRQRPTG